MKCVHHETCLGCQLFWSQLELRTSYLFKMNNEFLSFLCFMLKNGSSWFFYYSVFCHTENSHSVHIILLLQVHQNNFVQFACFAKKLLIQKIRFLIQKRQLQMSFSSYSFPLLSWVRSVPICQVALLCFVMLQPNLKIHC